MAEVGIVITAEDQATAVVKGMGTAAKASLKSVRSVADKAKNAFSVFGGAMAKVNQGLELGRKLWGAMRIAISDNVREALAFRRAGDPVLDWFAQMKRDTRLLRAAIGDALIPVIQTLAESLGLVGDGAQRWVQANRRVIATGVLGWAIKLAKALTTGIAAGVDLVTKAWFGWKILIDTVAGVLGKFVAFASSGMDRVLDKASEVATALGADGIAGQIDDARGAVNRFGQSWDKAGDAAFDAALQSTVELGKVEQRIDSLSSAIDSSLTQAWVDGQARIASSTVGTTKTIEEQTVAAKALADAQAASLLKAQASVDDALARMQADREIRLDSDLRALQAQEDARTATLEQSKTQMEGVFGAMAGLAGALGGALSAAGDETGAAIANTIGIVLDGVLSLLTILTSEAAVAAFAGGVIEGGGGLAGIAIGVAAATSAIATITALAGALGGQGSKPSVSAAGVGGGGGGGPRSVLTARQLTPVSGSQAGAADTSASGPTGRGVDVTINNNVLVPDQAVMDRVTIRQQNSIKRMAQQGKLIGQGVI